MHQSNLDTFFLENYTFHCEYFIRQLYFAKFPSGIMMKNRNHSSSRTLWSQLECYDLVQSNHFVQWDTILIIIFGFMTSLRSRPSHTFPPSRHRQCLHRLETGKCPSILRHCHECGRRFSARPAATNKRIQEAQMRTCGIHNAQDKCVITGNSHEKA